MLVSEKMRMIRTTATVKTHKHTVVMSCRCMLKKFWTVCKLCLITNREYVQEEINLHY